MIRILQLLFIIRFRKIVSKDDYLSIFLLCILYVSVAVIAFIYYIDFYNYLFLMLIDIIIHYINRKDIELLNTWKILALLK